MSLLDRIGKEAQKLRAEREAAAQERQRREERYEQIVAPAMEGLHDYLQTLARDLSEVRPPVHLRLQLAHYGELPLSVVHDYRIERQKRRHGYGIVMQWRARVDHERIREVLVHGHRKARQMIDQLRQLHLGGVRETEHAANGQVVSVRIHPRGFLHLQMQATASADDNYLRLEFQHLDSLGSTRKQVVAEQLDAAFYDRLGRFLVREDDDLIKEQLSPEMRARLQQALGTDEPLQLLSEHVLDPLLGSDEPFEVVDLGVDVDPDRVPQGGLDAPVEQAAPAPAPAAPAAGTTASPPAAPAPPPPAAPAPPPQASSGPPSAAAVEQTLDRSFAHLPEHERALLLQGSLRAIRPQQEPAADLQEDQQIKAAAFVLRMKLMEEKLRGKPS